MAPAVTDRVVSSTLVLAGRRALGGKDRSCLWWRTRFRPVEEIVQPRPGEVFVDLGSGTGRAVFVAAMFPRLAGARAAAPPPLRDGGRCRGALGFGDAPVELHCADSCKNRLGDRGHCVDRVRLPLPTLGASPRSVEARRAGAPLTEHFLRDDDAAGGRIRSSHDG